MKSSIIKAAVAIAIGFATGTSAAYAGPAPHPTMNGDNPPRQETTMEKIERGTSHIARVTWTETKDVTRTVVHSPVIAYQAARGERPLFRHETATRERSGKEHQQVALTGHRRVYSKPEENQPSHLEPQS